MVPAATAGNAWPTPPSTARSPQGAALCPSREDARTGSRGGGRPPRRVWRRPTHGRTVGRTTNKCDNQYQLWRTRESGAYPTQPAPYAQDQGVQHRAAMVGKTTVVVAGIHACGVAPSQLGAGIADGRANPASNARLGHYRAWVQLDTLVASRTMRSGQHAASSVSQQGGGIGRARQRAAGQMNHNAGRSTEEGDDQHVHARKCGDVSRWRA
jgi:hypothetical protein